MAEPSKTLIPKKSARLPEWLGIPARVLLLTFIGTLLTFAFCLLFGILGVLAISKLESAHPNMVVAYRRIALPGAIAGALITFAFSAVTEIRDYRQRKTLNAIERLS